MRDKPLQFRYILSNEQGKFSMPAGRRFIPSMNKKDVSCNEKGVIKWITVWPPGELKVYPDGTKVFTAETFHS